MNTKLTMAAGIGSCVTGLLIAIAIIIYVFSLGVPLGFIYIGASLAYGALAFHLGAKGKFKTTIILVTPMALFTVYIFYLTSQLAAVGLLVSMLIAVIGMLYELKKNTFDPFKPRPLYLIVTTLMYLSMGYAISLVLPKTAFLFGIGFIINMVSSFLLLKSVKPPTDTLSEVAVEATSD